MVGDAPEGGLGRGAGALPGVAAWVARDVPAGGGDARTRGAGINLVRMLVLLMEGLDPMGDERLCGTGKPGPGNPRQGSSPAIAAFVTRLAEASGTGVMTRWTAALGDPAGSAVLRSRDEVGVGQRVAAWTPACCDWHARPRPVTPR